MTDAELDALIASLQNPYGKITEHRQRIADTLVALRAERDKAEHQIGEQMTRAEKAEADNAALLRRYRWLIERGWHPHFNVTRSINFGGDEAYFKAIGECIDAAIAAKENK